jgi:hypothetical protein
MAFTGAQNANASHGTFNDVGNNQFNFNVSLANSASPCLEPAFSTTSFISSMVQQATGSREQLQALAASVGTLLKTLDAEYCAGRLSDTGTSMALDNLNTYVYAAASSRSVADL